MKKRQPPKVHGQPYDKSHFMWGLMYRHRASSKPRVVRMYERGRDAQREANMINSRWEKEYGWKGHWSVKRFMFYFRGAEIDAYEHEWERLEKGSHGR